MKSWVLTWFHAPPHAFPRSLCLPCKAFKPNVTIALWEEEKRINSRHFSIRGISQKGHDHCVRDPHLEWLLGHCGAPGIQNKIKIKKNSEAYPDLVRKLWSSSHRFICKQPLENPNKPLFIFLNGWHGVWRFPTS